MVDVRRLRVLCEVARKGSFSAGAAALGYTQPAVSRQVALLESEVGVLLVQRLPHGIALTDAGRLLVARGESILSQLDAAVLEVGALAGLEGGRLRFAAFSSACASIVPLAIARFRTLYPAVELSVSMHDPAESIPLLRSGSIDLALSNDPDTAESGDRNAVTVSCAADGGSAGRTASDRGGRPSVEVVHLFEDPMYVALPAGHPLADADAVSLEDFASEPWMLATPGSCPDFRLLQRACHAAGFEPRVAFQNDDYSIVLGFVAAGVGVALIPDMVARGVRGDVVVRGLDPPPPARPVLAALPAGYRSPAAAAMLEVLQTVAEDWVEDRLVLVGTRGG